MTTNIPTDLQEFVAQQIANGVHASTDDVVRDALRVLRELTERRDQLRNAIHVGPDEEARLLGPLDVEALIDWCAAAVRTVERQSRKFDRRLEPSPLAKQRSHYAKQICDSLIGVLENCCQLDRLRLAGYAANIDFWLEEVRHRLHVIDGFSERREQFVAGTKAAYSNEIVATRPFVEPRPVLSDVHDTAKWRELQEDLVELRKGIVGKFARFVQRCYDFKLIDQDKYFDLKHSLDAVK